MISRGIGHTEGKLPGLKKTARKPCVPLRNDPNEKDQNFRQTVRSWSSENTPVDLNFIVGLKLNIATLISLNIFGIEFPRHPTLS